MNAPLPLSALHAGQETLQVQVRAIRLEAHGIHSYELVSASGDDLPRFEAGSHIDVHLPHGHTRAYSLAGDPADASSWLLGVLREPSSGGGSRHMHEALRVGELLSVGPVRNAFPMAARASHSVLIAGGIGITPIKSMAHVLAASGRSFELHYCAKSKGHAAFLAELERTLPAGALHLHFDGGDPAKGLDLQQLLAQHKEGTHLYYCGPAGLMSACAQASRHWPQGAVHSEHFKALQPATSALADGVFEVHLVRSGQRIEVQPEQTIVRAIELAGMRVPTSCLSGLCGACKVNFLDGEVDHRDFILSDEEKQRCLTVCVSRAKSKLLTLDL